MNRRSLLVPLFLFIFLPPLFAADRPIIRCIQINRKNVFETGHESDRHFPYSWGNKIHIVTRESYIANELLFQAGDELDMEKIHESERLLRSRTIFRYVKITVMPPENGYVEILVETEDVWTTAVEASYSIAGGKNSYSLGVLEQNFLGTGKSVGAFVRKDIDRTTRGVSYRDPQLLGTRWDLFGGYGKDEKGREYEAYIERPYYSIATRHSEGASIRDSQNEDRLFQNTEEIANFHHHEQEMRVFGSFALKASDVFVRRLSLAIEHHKDEFADVKGPQPPVLPEVREVDPVLLGADIENIRFHKVYAVTTFDRDEDVNLGGTFFAEAGPSMERLGSTRNGWFGRLAAGKNFHFAEDQVWFNALKVDGRLEKGVVQNGVLRFRSHYFLVNWIPENTASLRGEYIVSKNLDPERQFLLGGDTGLRGYSVRQFGDTNRVLFTLENRRGVLYDWLHLVSMGWAVFADAGAVWNEHPAPPIDRFRSDVGAGLRLAPSRSTNPGLVRIDLAYALQDNQRSSRFVINIGADISFGDERQARKFDQ